MTDSPPLSSRGVLSHGIISVAAQGINSLVTYFAMLVIINELGEARFGAFSYTMVITGITSMLADFGMNPILLRRMSREPERSRQFILEATLVRVALIAPTALVTNLIAVAQGQDSAFLLMLNVMLVNMVISAKLPIVRGTLETFFRSRARMSIPVLLALLDSTVLLILALGWKHWFRMPLDAMLLYTASNLGGFLVILFWVFRLLRKEPVLPWKAETGSMADLLRESAPLAIFLFLNALHLYIDSIYLERFFSKQEVGEYNAALRLIVPLLYIPTMVGWAVAPFIARASGEGGAQARERIRMIFGLGMKSLFLFGAVVAVAGWREAELIVRLAFGGKYGASVVPLIFYLASYPVVALNLFQVETNNALGLQRRNTAVALVMAAVSVAAGYPIVAAYGIIGAATTKAIAVVAGFLFLFFLLRRETGWDARIPALKSLGVLAAAFVPALLIPDGVWYIRIPAVATVILAAALAAGYFTREERQLWKAQLAPLIAIAWRR